MNTMRSLTFRTLTLRTLLVAAAPLLVSACDETNQPLTPDVVEESTDDLWGWGHGRRAGRFDALTVMTRNLYLGGDTGPVFGADFSNPLEVVQVSAAVWAEVLSSNVSERMSEIADEIARERPDLIALQEAFQFIELDLTSGVPQPVQVIDLLAVLEAELAARGLPYRTLAVRPNTDATLPTGLDLSTGQVTSAVKFLDRIAVLAHDDLKVADVQDANYLASFPLTEGVVLKRGWIRVDTERRGVPYHFIATHLETQRIGPIHDAQGAELRTSIAAGLDGVTIIAGDLNSDAAAEAGDPSWTPTYGSLIDAGFLDAWLHANGRRRGQGFTCCNDPDLLNTRPGYDERIDFVLIRGDGFDPGRVGFGSNIRTHLVGERYWDRTPSGLWPSDHAGVVAELRVRRGRGGPWGPHDD